MFQVLSLMATHSEVGTGAQRLVQVMETQSEDRSQYSRTRKRYTQVYQRESAYTRRFASVKARICGKLIFGPWRLFLGSWSYGFGPWRLDERVDP